MNAHLVRVVAFAVAIVVVGSVGHAADPAVTCESSKLKEAGKYDSCRLVALSKAVKTGDPLDYTKCDGKFGSKWPDIESKAGGLCPSNGDQAEINQRIVEHNDDIATLLSGGVVATHKSPATGQTATYGTGDDGDIAPGAALGYADNGDGTFTDLNTGLMWEKKVAYNSGSISCTSESGSCANPHDANNVYSWTASSPSYDGTVVTILLKQLNDRCDNDTTIACTTEADCTVPGGACGFAGHRDWRLPTVKELQSIVDYSVAYPGPTVYVALQGASCGPACTDRTDPACSCTSPSVYWSSTTDGTFAYEAWRVRFDDGSVGQVFKSTESYVRAVRGGS